MSRWHSKRPEQIRNPKTDSTNLLGLADGRDIFVPADWPAWPDFVYGPMIC
jgi:hypothetical protein